MVPIMTSKGDWIFNDNLLDQVSINQDPYQPMNAEYNGYWLTRDGSLLMNNDGTAVTNDQFLNGQPPYQVGPFGNYYMAPGTVLEGNGSTNANQLGLYYYTTRTNQALGSNSVIDIGLYYVATSSNANGWEPLETNGIPDYIADVNGNGIIPPAATDPGGSFYTNIDLDADGMVGAVESALRTSPVVFDNPLSLNQTRTDWSLGTVTFVVTNAFIPSAGQLVLMVNGIPVTTNLSSQTNGQGYPELTWDTTPSAPSISHYLQAHLILTNPATSVGVTGDGPLVAINHPDVIIYPSSQTNGLGGTATFTAQPNGLDLYTYTYQWQEDGTNIPGATNSTYTIANLATNNTDAYTVIVDNGDGNPVTSAAAVLTVENIPFAITFQPLSQQVMKGDAVTLAASVVGTAALSYQWQMWNPTSATWSSIPSATNNSFTMLNFEASDAGSYCVIISSGTNILASLPATLAAFGPSVDEFCIVVVGPRQDYTFRGDTTYFLGAPYAYFGDASSYSTSSSEVDLYGNTTIEGRTVIKFDNNANPSLIVHGGLTCQTGPYQPAIFTSIDDFSQGEVPNVLIGGFMGPQLYPIGTGYPQTPLNRVAYLDLDDADGVNANCIHDLRFCYADQAVTTPTNTGSLQVWNCQFYECNSGVNSRLPVGCSTNQLHNVLFSGCYSAVAAQNSCAEVDAEQVTADVFSFWDSQFPPSKVCLTNTIVLGNFGSGPLISNQNVAINPPDDSFEPMDEGSYYLANGSLCRNAGTASISTTLAGQLRYKTTWAPVQLLEWGRWSFE